MLQVLRRRGGPAMASAFIAVAVMAMVLAACSNGPAAQVATPARSSTTAAAAAATVGGSARPYQLYTHCGIEEARIGKRYFEVVDPLNDGQGNPPPGWGNPYQRGTMTLVSASEAVFRDHAGHQVRFRLRPGATAFKHLCS